MFTEVQIGNKIVQMYDRYLVELNKAVSQHPDLIEMLSKKSHADIEEKIALIAHYCDVVVDGPFLALGMQHLCEQLTDILRAKSIGIILPN